MKLFRFLSVFLAATMLFGLSFSALIGSPVEETSEKEDNTVTIEPFAAPVDRSSSVNITSVSIIGVTNGSLDFDQGPNPASYSNGINPFEYAQLIVNWDATLSGSETFSTGDYFNIPLSLPDWTASDTTWGDMLDGPTVIGQWRIYQNNIEVVLGDNANGVPSLSSTLSTGSSYLRWGGYKGYDFVASFQVGATPINASFQAHDFRSNKFVLNKRDQDWKSSLGTSNENIQWYATLGQPNLAKLWRNEPTEIKNSIIEDTLVDATSVSNFRISSFIQIPISLNPGSIGISTIPCWSYNVTSYFTRTDGSHLTETYAQYKARIEGTAFTYGVYTAADGTLTVVANYGRVGQDGLTYSELDPNFAANAAAACVSQGYFHPDDEALLAQQIEAAYGSTNAFGGHLAQYVIYPTATYTPVLDNKLIDNTAIQTYDGTTNVNLTYSTSLQGISGTTVAAPYNAIVLKSDIDTSVMLPGATFKLQNETSPGIWVDYTPNDSGTLLRQTNAQGKAEFNNLGFGNYRMIETEAPIGYDLSQTIGYDANDNVAYVEYFSVINGETEGHVISVGNKLGDTLTVIYNAGTQGTFPDDIHSDLLINQDTPAYAGSVDTQATNQHNIGNPTGNAGYYFTGWEPQVENRVTKNITYVAQWSPVPNNNDNNGGNNENPNAPEKEGNRVIIPKTGSGLFLTVLSTVAIITSGVLLLSIYKKNKSN